MKKWIWLFLVLNSSVFAQKQGQNLIDSLLKELPKIHNDTLKARTYKRIQEEYFFIDTDKALYYSRLGLVHVTKMPWKRGIAVFNSALGRAYSDKGNFDSCLFFYKKALTIQKEIDDKWNIASTLNNMGAAEQNIASNYPKATQYYFEGLKWAEVVNDNYLIGVCYENISNIYFTQKNYQKALKYAFEALRFRQKGSKEANTLREVGQSLSSIAAIYTDMKEIKKALSYYQKALLMHQKVGNKEGIAKSYTYISTLQGNNFSKKINYGLQAKRLWDEVNPMHLEAIVNVGNLGRAYFDVARNNSPANTPKHQQLNLAKKYLEEAIQRSKQKKDINNETYFLGILAEVQAFLGDYKNAYLNFRMYQEVQDSLYSQENKNKIADLEGQREIGMRDKQLKINQLELDNQRKQRIGLLVGLGLLTVIGGLLFWQNQIRKRTNTTLLHLNTELDEANKVKAKFFAILSHDLRSPVANLINFLHLQKEAPELLTPAMTATHQKRITESAEALLETMESMLLWSKGQMQNFKPQVKTIEIEALFTYIQKFFSGTTNVTFSFDNPAALQVVTDEDYLKTIMQNLTNNAIKALKNTPNAHIRWEAQQKNNQVVLAIIDNGPGASAQQLSALHSDETAIGIKTGLGLHLIRDLAKAIMCQISVKSTPDIGTEFQLTFVNS